MLSTKKRASIVTVMTIVLGMFTCVWAAEIVNIKVSPNVLNIKSEGGIVTVNAEIDYSTVNSSTVTLAVNTNDNSVKISRWESDNKGNFVAQFLLDEVKKLDFNIGEYNKFMLSGSTNDGREFSGYQEVLVLPKKMPKK